MIRVIRRAVRLTVQAAVAGLCLLSLLACLGTAWLWWRSGRAGGYDEVEAVGGPVRVEVGVMPGPYNKPHLKATVVGRWPGPSGVWVRSIPEHPSMVADRVHPFAFPRPDEWRRDRWGPWTWESGSLRAFLGPDGRPERETLDGLWRRVPGAPDEAVSGPLPMFGVYKVPFWQPMAAAAGPSLLWLAVRGRRARVRRRRRRLGLCLSCGYDLRAAPEPGRALLRRCPECGTIPAVPAGGVATAVSE